MFSLDQMHEYKSELLPTDYFNILPSKCIHCKHTLVINHNRTIMRCSNYYCPEHMSYRAAKMFSDMGVDNVGPSKAYEIIVRNKLKTHLDILGLNLTDLPNKYSEEHKKQIYISLQKGREQTLDSILSYFQINNLGDKKATLIMEGFNSFAEFFEVNPNFEKVLIHLRRALNQANYTNTLTLMAYHMYNVKEDLIRVEKYFKVTKLVKDKIRVCITGEIVSVYSPNFPFKPRKNFIDFLNKKYEGIISIVNSGSNLSDSDFLLTDSTTRTTKYKSASSLGVAILSFSKFTEMIEANFGEGKEELKIVRRI